MASVGQGLARASSSAGMEQHQQKPRGEEKVVSLFSLSRNKTMPVTRAEYEGVAPEWKLNCIISEQGLPPTLKQQLGGCF